MRCPPPLRYASLLLAGISLPAMAAGAEPAPAFIRTLDGSATLVDGDGVASEAARHDPIEIGDLLALDAGTRGEVLLPDASRVRATGPVELFLDAAESDDPAELDLVLELGELQVRTFARDGGDLVVDTAMGVLFLSRPGEYRIGAGADGLSIVVRAGRVEALVGERSLLVREGEQARITNEEWPRIELRGAPALDELERWAASLELDAEQGAVPWVDPDLRYAAGSLSDHGSWLALDGGTAWRPYAIDDWQPYNDGHWSYASDELYWVSYEPWGWLPYHYGYWDRHPLHGWVWFPGRSYAGAHVTFHWGDTWVGWTPTHHYRRHGRAGYDERGYDRHSRSGWVYCPTDNLGRRNQNRFHADRGHEADGHRRAAPEAVITDDTRGLSPDNWRTPGRARTLLRSRAAVPRHRVPEGTDRTAFRGLRIEPRESAGTRSDASPTLSPRARPRRPASAAVPQSVQGAREPARAARRSVVTSRQTEQTPRRPEQTPRQTEQTSRQTEQTSRQTEQMSRRPVQSTHRPVREAGRVVRRETPSASTKAGKAAPTRSAPSRARATRSAPTAQRSAAPARSSGARATARPSARPRERGRSGSNGAR